MKKILILIFVFIPMVLFAMPWDKKKEVKTDSLIPHVDSMIGIAYSFEPPSGHSAAEYLLQTVRPFVGFGCRPFVFLRLNSPALEGLGFGVHTKVFSTGIDMYYAHEKMKPFFLAFTLGWDWYGNTIPGASFGTRF